MVAKREQSVFFPWEKPRGIRATVGRARGRQILFGAGALALFALVRARESYLGHVRATRATITTTISAVMAWRADHDRACPNALSDLVSGGYLHRVPRDAWGRPLRLTCPGRRDPRGFDVLSDGPDGTPGGLDRVE